ncbi:hypothetical protein GQX74_004513 [Glossina fuscipes]|nr:hypothetical protein GQX74_004513 [Glossina fuscipes]
MCLENTSSATTILLRKAFCNILWEIRQNAYYHATITTSTDVNLLNRIYDVKNQQWSLSINYGNNDDSRDDDGGSGGSGGGMAIKVLPDRLFAVILNVIAAYYSTGIIAIKKVAVKEDQLVELMKLFHIVPINSDVHLI